MTWFSMALKLIGAATYVVAFLKSTMIDQKTALISGHMNLSEVNINRGIFQGVSLSHLVFIISLIPLTLVLRRTKQGYSFQKGKSKLKHLPFMDNEALWEEPK